MVYKRRGGSLRRGYAKRRKYTRRPRGITRRVKRVERRTKRIMSTIETKQYQGYTTGLAGYSATTPDAFYTLAHPIGEGTGIDQAVGLQYTITSINFTAQMIPSSVGIHNRVRFLVIQDKEPNANDFNMTYYLTNVGGLASNGSVDSLYNWNYRRRYRILYDKKSWVGETAETMSKPYAVFSGYIKKRIKITKVSSGGTFAQIQKSSIWLVAISDSDVGVPISLQWRVKYQDA